MNLPVNKTTVSNSFCPSYTRYSTYLISLLYAVGLGGRKGILGSPGQRAVKRVCVYACVRVSEYLCLSPTRLAWMSSLVWLAGAGPMYYQQQQPPAEPPAPAAPPGRRERRIIDIIDPRTGVNIIPDHRDSSVAEMKPLKNEVVAL